VCSDGVEQNLIHGVEGPSCTGGLTCVGVSCCQNTLVVGGTFPMGRSESSCDAANAGMVSAEQPEHDASVADFRLDTFEVTVGRFRRFVQQYDGTPPAEGAGAHPLLAGSGWQSAWNSSLLADQASLMNALKCQETNQTWTDTEAGNESYAITCVSWYEAFAFCAWDGGRLPTEAEWEYAAAGGMENRLYPWGQQSPTPARANWTGSDNTPLLAVGTHPSGAGRWGHQDLAGNLQEWTLDLWDNDWYATGGANCVNCANLGDDPDRVQRGGSWDQISPTLRSAFRNVSLYPMDRFASDGFRCAR
jgi:formylglycine-generating enzyme required for sulfatase activity